MRHYTSDGRSWDLSAWATPATGDTLTDTERAEGLKRAVASALTSPVLAERVLAAVDAARPEFRANAVTQVVARFVSDDAAVRVALTGISSGRPSNDRDGARICDYGPNTEGPQEDCPFHGRPYAYWVERGDALATDPAPCPRCATHAGNGACGCGE